MLIVGVHRSPAVAVALLAFVAFPIGVQEASMLIIKGPDIGPEDIERIQQEMRDWKAAQRVVVEQAMTIVLEHQTELARRGFLPEPRPRP